MKKFRDFFYFLLQPKAPPLHPSNLNGLWVAALALFWLLASTSAAQEGRHGVGHERWHAEFYSKLKRPDLPQHSCCSLTDCSPTTARMSPHGYYEVMVEGRWVIVPQNKIVKVSAPDGGAHVCAPKQNPDNPVLYCVVLPPET